MFSLALSLFSCSNEDFLTTQSDETKVVSFSIDTGMDEVTAKAREGYRDWASDDPTTFGAYGLYNRKMDEKLFDNQRVTRSGSAWTYSPLKYWADYTWCETFDFFGYMPHMSADTSEPPAARNGVKFEQGGVGHENEYTLSFPVALSDAVLGDANKANIPLICHLPIHKDKVGDVINYEMDQVLTGFSLQFKMGTEMAELRDFVIKEVKITGAATTMPNGGMVSRTYTYTPSTGAWGAGDVTWSNITKKADAVNYIVPFVDHGNGADNDAYDATNSTLRVGYSFKDATSQWGGNFYTIPSSDFTPTISVKYDVTVQDEDGNYIKTREDITSTIEFSSSYFNFTDYAGGSVGKVHPIVVQIVPSYLYVLADADQRASWMIIE